MMNLLLQIYNDPKKIQGTQPHVVDEKKNWLFHNHTFVLFLPSRQRFV
jgi:hypothetical protein